MDYGTAILARELAKNRVVHNVVDADPVMNIKYVGSEESGKVAIVAAAEEFVFTHGDLGSEAADDTIEVGSTEGSIDVSEAEANTLGEIVDIINESPNWEARLIGGLRSDTVENDGTSHKAAAAAQAKTDAGITVLNDTNVALIMTAGAFEGAYQNKIGGECVDVDESNYVHSLVRVVSNGTYGSGDLTISVYQVDEGTNTETLVASWAGAATTVEQSKDLFAELGGLTADRGKILKVRMTGSAALTAGFIEAQFRSITY
jgi:hypothetical protein